MGSDKHPFSYRWLYLSTFIFFLILDQVVKAWVRANLNLHQSPGYPWPGVFEITLTYNKGIAFGMYQGLGIIFTPIALLMTLFSFFYSYKRPSAPGLLHFALGLLSAGAIGNLIDRLWFGKVTDMFWFRLINFPVFNVADACVTVAAVLLGYYWIFDGKSSS